MSHALDRAVADLPLRFPGPGGACAVLREGEVLARHAWGWANAERRVPFTPGSLFRVCSITKQFTCAALLDLVPDPSVLEGALRARLPWLEGEGPGVLHLAHNQSGLRDYWALAMLHGSPAEAAFGEREAAAVIGGTRSLQFRPGTRYSYSNGNFRLLSDLMEERAGRPFAELLRRSVLGPAGMETAFLAADTRAMPDGTEGYEGDPASGFRAAENRVIWTGDAGLGASLDDLIAYERWIDRTRDDPGSTYARLSAPVRFADGAPAAYGFGLGRRAEGGRAATGHGGALRGWRSHRVNLRAERVSVVVLFNHMADAQAAAGALLAALLGEAPASAGVEAGVGADAAAVPPGNYVEPETGLLARVEVVGERVSLRFGPAPETLGTAGGTVLRPDGDGVRMERPGDNLFTRLLPLEGEARRDVARLDVAGRFRCAELDAELSVVDAGGVSCGAFSGMLGSGRMEALTPHGADTWTLPCPRALDHLAPGDWTLRFHRNGVGEVAGVEVGCWLARGLRYERA